MDIDNLSYYYGLSERARERMDTVGHILLTDDDADKLSRTKIICVAVTIFFTMWAVQNQSMSGAFFLGCVLPGFFKLAEVRIGLLYDAKAPIQD